MRLLVVNPNTSSEATAAFVELAQRAARPDTEIVGATGRFGARLMRTPAETAIGTHAALEAIALHARGCDAVIVAAFGDYGASAGRSLVDVPVISIADAAFSVLRLGAARFAILTVAQAVVPMLQRTVAEQGLADRMCGIDVAEPASDRPASLTNALEVLVRLVDSVRPDVLLAVGPPLAPLVPELRAASPVPVIEGVACAVKLAEALVGLGLQSASREGGDRSQADYPGLAPELAAALTRARP